MKLLKGKYNMYRNLNDYEILYMVSEDRDINFDILYDKYKPLIKNMAKEFLPKFKKFGYEIDDLMQIGYITLFKSAKMYDEYNNAMFYTYFKKALIFSYNTEIKANKTLKKETLNNAMSYDISIKNTDLFYSDMFPNMKNYYDSEYWSNVINFKNSMPYDMSCIFELYYNGFTFDEISKIMEKDIQTIKRRFYKIKRHAFTYKYLFFS